MTHWITRNRRWMVGILAGVALCVAFLAVTYLGWYQKEHRIQGLMQFSLLLGVAFLYVYRHPLHDRDWLLLAMLFAGMVMRFGYALYTPTTVRYHDLAPIDIRATGHAGYVLTLFETGALPQSNAFQYAQPPLYYAVAALFMKGYQALSGLTNSVELFEAVRLPSCLASCAALLIGVRIAQELSLGRRGLRILTAVCAFLPNHYLLAGRANPDSLSVLFLFCVVWFALCWYRDPSMRHTILLALSFGLGMMTKMTVAVLAIPVGLGMIVILVRSLRKRQARPLIRRLMLFGLIAAPLGLWYPLRNAILFGQPLNAVYQMSLSDPQYIGALPLAERYGIGNLSALFTSPFVNRATDINTYGYLLKTAVFGEFSYSVDPTIPLLLTTANLALVALSLLATVLGLLRAIRARDGRWLLIVGCWLAALGAYLWFTLRYPFFCSLDFRYAVVTSLCGALLLAAQSEQKSDSRWLRAMFQPALNVALIAFVAASVVMYTNIA